MNNKESIKRGKRKPRRTVNPVILFQWVVILALSVALIFVSIGNKDGGEEKNDNSSTSSQTVSEQNGSENSSSEETSSKPDSSEVDMWYLKLVNAKVKVSEAEISSVKTASIKSKYTNKDMVFDERALSSLEEMCEAALKDGVKLTIGSAYRTYSYQNGLYERKVNQYTQKGYSEQEAMQTAATIVARPGTSEHNIGLAVDFTPIDDSFETTKQYKWLSENAEKYGFIQRYKKAKSEITGIVNESWHYRYVTPEHAKIMNELGLCLEEYIDYLKK